MPTPIITVQRLGGVIRNILQRKTGRVAEPEKINVPVALALAFGLTADARLRC
jgi:hypothetical protein